jgi:FAD/FMN-containing dehydrogenase
VQHKAYTTQSSASDCLAIKQVPASQAGITDFEALKLPFNFRLNYTPSFIIKPLTQQHVADAVYCANQNGVKVQARSGGHSYASFSTGGQDGSMIVDLANFNQVTVGPGPEYIVKFGGGTRLGNLDLEMFRQGGRTVSHGTCSG